ncbi:hypothetical protein ABIC09_003193 [Bradyrhizobium sp. S3.12.5]|uniref:hypothetical protein n=1 Tax=Bradyrhizobium sp. S3.12.5 TaxID=3156386 RepID=UPI00339911D6
MGGPHQRRCRCASEGEDDPSLRQPERGAEEVGDVDLFIEFTTMDLGLDLTPEDQQREWERSEELVAISEYLSPSSFIDWMLMGDVPMRQAFPRLGVSR